ncbi:MAG: 5'-nucleotidase C-terminal domain-containing protein, partial [Flavobacteriaceae bacterium]|nr:5'-nucleotidase C-terminal domain-containing protein [Flavobacteriaceae bacterium]
MIFRKIIILSLFILTLCCNQKNYVSKIEGEQIAITDSLAGDAAIESFIKPYRENITRDLDSVIAYSVDTYTKSDGELNSAIGNLMADIVYEQSNPVFNSRTGKNLDMVLLNHGGIRAILSKGDVTKRTAYEIMPFENSVV